VQIGHLEEAAGRLTGQRVSNELMLVVLVVSLGALIELYKDMLVYLGVVGGTCCVTWSIDRIVQRHACITWGVECIRTCILLC
jgi:hypothetical protein